MGSKVILRDVLQFKRIYGDGFGIEIETESDDGYRIPELDYWGAHEDGSLRRFGIEYVLKEPLAFKSKAYYSALDEFEKGTTKCNFIDSVYTSTHVHLNMQNKELEKIFNFMTLYLLSEEVLGKYCGPKRNGNLFCLKTSAAEANLNTIEDVVDSVFKGRRDFLRQISYLNENNNKYSGMNVVPLKQLGTIEIRTLSCAPKTELVHRWVGILNCLYESMENYANPSEVLDYIKGLKDYRAFFEKTFGNYVEFFDLSNLEKEMRNPIWYASRIAAYNDASWASIETLFAKPKKDTLTVKDIEQMDVNEVYTWIEEAAMQNRVARVEEMLTVAGTGPNTTAFVLNRDF